MEKAVYRDQKLEMYRGNPMIEALPPIPEDEREVLKNLVGLIEKITTEQREMKPYLRMHLLKKIEHEFFYPFAQVRKLDLSIHMMIRSAYLNRNPLNMEYNELLIELDKQKTKEFSNSENPIITQEAGTVIFGMSGSGKSRALRQCLSYYPTAIRHEVYNGKAFTKTQLPWLIVDAPFDGSYVTFCRTVFKEIDKRCDGNSLEKYGYTTHSSSTMILHMQKLLLLYNVGILVIDEVQNILNAKAESSEILAFFLSLTNQLGVPIIYCGTSNAIKLFQSRMAVARRQIGAGDMKFQQIDRNNGEWENMMKYLWRGYILQEDVLINDEMLDVFWECSQGLIGIVVPLFCRVQINALLSGRESFDIAFVYKTCNEDLAIIKPMLDAIKSGDEWEILKYEDICLDLGSTIDNGIKELQHQEELEKIIESKMKSVDERRLNTADNIFTTIRGMRILKEIEDNKLKSIIRTVVEKNPVNAEEGDLLQAVILSAMQQPAKEHKRGSGGVNSSGLIGLFEQAEKKHKHMHDVLQENGYIKKIEDDFSDLVG